MDIKIRKGTDGVFECRLYLGRGFDGKAIRPYKQFPNAATESEALELAETWAANLTANGEVKSARLIDLLADYVQLRERNGASPNSIRNYRLFTHYVAKFLRTANARDLSVMDFNRFEQALLAPKSDGGQGLCRNSVINVHNFLRGAYNHFVDAGICDANPIVYVSKPSPERHEAAAITEWDFEHLNAKLEAALSVADPNVRDYRRAVYAFAAWLALTTGMRVGEVCAIHRTDVKRYQMFLHVGGNVIEGIGEKPYRRNVTKGRKCRNIAVTQDDIRVIDSFIRAQNAVLGHLDADVPLVTLDGSYMRPTTISRAFSRIRDSCGLPREVTFHSLRHTHASWLIANGCDLKTLSERMGHADEATTLRIYGHLMPGRDAIAAQLFSEAKRRAIGGISD
ncbi:MAG: tyrosine-type recombinase/integrase [Collinsella sp.]